MAHFAELDEQGTVSNVICVNNDALEHDEFPASEDSGIRFCIGLFGGGIWKQTSYTGAFRRRFATIGGHYDAELDAFISPKPYPSWHLNRDTTEWEAPIPMPLQGIYRWNEESKQWDEVIQDGEPDYEVV
jgi:hypothetical protein